MRFSFGQGRQPFPSLFSDCLNASQFLQMMDEVFFSFFRGDVEFLSHLVPDLRPLRPSIQQVPDAGGCFIQRVDAFQVADSLPDRNKDVFFADFPEDDGIAFSVDLIEKTRHSIPLSTEC